MIVDKGACTNCDKSDVKIMDSTDLGVDEDLEKVPCDPLSSDDGIYRGGLT